jgi:drug/metabolite transporter (DMT)-like permease
MLLGFVGVALLVTPGGAGNSWEVGFIIGAIAIQVGSLGWQYGSLIGKYKLKNVPLLASAGLQMLFGGAIVGIVAIAIGEPARFAVNTRTLAALIYLTLFGSILAYSAYVYALAHLRTTKVSMYAYVNPVVAVFLGWLILDEQLTWVSLLAMCIILGGVALVQMSRHPAAAAVPEVVVEKNAA